MKIRRDFQRQGFTLIELLVVVAIIAVLIGLLLPAVQKVREAAARARCQNNLKQLAIAMHSCQDVKGSLPTYQGTFPSASDSHRNNNKYSVDGSWFVHILPFIEQDGLYKQIQSDVQAYTNTGYTVSAPGGPLITPAVPATYDYTGLTYVPAVPATYNNYTGSQQYVASTSANGYTVYTLQWVPPRTPDAGTGTSAHWVNSMGQTVSPPILTPAQPAVYGAPGAPVNGYVGVWKTEVRGLVFRVLRCDSDISAGGSGGQYVNGQVYYNSGGRWGVTNYLANYNALSGSPNLGYRGSSRSLVQIEDGTSTTVLFGEGYGWCEGRGRAAMMAWFYENGINNNGGVHNFGLLPLGTNNQIGVGGGSPVSVGFSYGMPNPSINPDLTFMFQVKPVPMAAASCPAGKDCCNSLTVQTGHDQMLVCMADGSVKSLNPGMSVSTWRAAVLPSDGVPLGSDW